MASSVNQIRLRYSDIIRPEEIFEFPITGDRVRIGRGADNDLVLPNPFVPVEALVLYRRNKSGSLWELVAIGIDCVQVNDESLQRGDRANLTGDQVIKVFPYTFRLELPNKQSVDDPLTILERQSGEFVSAVHGELLERMGIKDGESVKNQSQSREALAAFERTLEEIAKLKGLLQPNRKALQSYLAGLCVRGVLLGKVVERMPRRAASIWDEARGWSRLVSAVPDREAELEKTIEFVASKLELEKLHDITDQTNVVEHGFWPVWRQLQSQLSADLTQYLALRYLKKEVKDIVFGYGPLEDLLRMPTISEIMVVQRDHIYVERGGTIENSGRRFVSDDMTLAVIERIVSKVGRRIDKSQPLVDARLLDGSRVNAVIPPLAVSGPCITVRKFPARKLLIEDLIDKGSLTRTVAEFLRASVLNRCNILISGGTGTGKTTLLNCLSDFIPDDERIVTIEDTAELQLKKEHVVQLETKQKNVEGEGEYTIRDLVKNSLRMRPDRIVVGECRGPEALDMLQAMNTGHDGSLTTVHANTSEDVILRLEVLVQMAADLPLSSIHRQIASAIDLIVQLTRMKDGSRRVTQVTEVMGYDEDTSLIRMKDLFVLSGDEEHMQLCATGRLPTFMDKLIERGLKLESFYL